MSRAELDEACAPELLELPVALYDDDDEDCAFFSSSSNFCRRSLAELPEELPVPSVDDESSAGGGPGGGPPCAPPGPWAKAALKTPLSSVA